MNFFRSVSGIIVTSFFIFCISGFNKVDAQQTKLTEKSAIVQQTNLISTLQADSVYYVVDEFPVFPGGAEGVHNFIVENLNYPAEAIDAGITGDVFITFVVNKAGQVENAQVTRTVHSLLDKEALRIVNSFPSWTPGRKGGQNVKVSYTIPIKFQLE